MSKEKIKQILKDNLSSSPTLIEGDYISGWNQAAQAISEWSEGEVREALLWASKHYTAIDYDVWGHTENYEEYTTSELLQKYKEPKKL